MAPPPMECGDASLGPCKTHRRQVLAPGPNFVRQPHRPLCSHTSRIHRHIHTHPPNRTPQLSTAVIAMPQDCILAASGLSDTGANILWIIGTSVSSPQVTGRQNRTVKQPHILTLRCLFCPTRLFSLFLPSRRKLWYAFHFSFICAVQRV
jgi:hypothetical protein